MLIYQPVTDCVFLHWFTVYTSQSLVLILSIITLLKKKTGTANFDAPVGSYDRAEVCELVGCYIFNQLSTVMRKELIGLYRDASLDIMKNISGPEIE